MNKIRAIQELNKKEIEQGISPNASWHRDYRDTAFIYFGGLPYELTEGDVITIFSQYGEPVFLKLARDRDSGKSKGFGWLKYEDQRSTDLAVDNLGGATIGGRLISVDHARYKPRDDEDLEEGMIGWEDLMRKERESKGAAGDEDTEMGSGVESEEERVNRPMLREERELQLLIEGHDDDDPMKEFLVEEKKKEVEEALRRERKKLERGEKSRHKSRHHHRSRRDESGDEDKERRHRRHRDEDDEGKRRRDGSRRRDDKGDEGRRERQRPGSRERETKRDDDRRRHRDEDDRDRRRDRNSDRRRRDRGESEDGDNRRHRDSERERRHRRERSRSP